MSKHTLGDWQHTSYGVLGGHKTALVADCFNGLLSEHECAANARLIAAAPIGSTLAHTVLETATIETPQVLLELAK